MLSFPDRFRGWPWRRIGIVAAIVGVLASGGYVAYRLRGMDIRTPVRLPFAHHGEVLELDHAHFVHLTIDGEVLLGSERVTLDELTARTVKDKRPVVICADANARALHLLYVQGACEGSVTYLAVTDGWRTALMPTSRHSSAVIYVPFTHVIPVSGTSTASGRSLEFVVVTHENPEMRVEDVRTAVGEILDSIEQWNGSAEESNRDKEEQHKQPLFELENWGGSLGCDSRAPVSLYVKAFDVVYGMDCPNFEALRLRAAPWVCRQDVLPSDVGRVPFHLDYSGVETQFGRFAIEPPVAKNVTSDRWEDRLRVDVSPEGEVIWRSEPRTLRELATIFKTQGAIFDRKHVRLGKPSRDGPANRFSTLPLDVRVDRNVEWGHVRQLLHLANSSSLRRHSIVVVPELDSSWSREEARVFGSFRNNATVRGSPLPVALFEVAFDLPLAWESGAAADAIGVKLDCSPGDHSVTYSIGGRPATSDVMQRDEWIRALASGTFVPVVIDAAVPLWRVVELIDFLRECELKPLLEPFPDELPPELLARDRLR